MLFIQVYSPLFIAHDALTVSYDESKKSSAVAGAASSADAD
jgi:hypothetical protein